MRKSSRQVGVINPARFHEHQHGQDDRDQNEEQVGPPIALPPQKPPRDERYQRDEGEIGHLLDEGVVTHRLQLGDVVKPLAERGQVGARRDEEMDALHHERDEHGGAEADEEREVFAPTGDEVENYQHGDDERGLEERRPAGQAPGDAGEEIPGALGVKLDLPALVLRGEGHGHQDEGQRQVPGPAEFGGEDERGQGGRANDQQRAADQAEFTRTNEQPKKEERHPQGRGDDGAGPIERMFREEGERRVENEDNVVKRRRGAGDETLGPVLDREMILDQPLPGEDALDAGELGIAIGLDRPRMHRRRVLRRVGRHPFRGINRAQPQT